MKATRLTSSNRPVYSCIRCSNRKVKCDRQDPCSACRKHNVQCTFRPVRQPQKKQKRLKREVLIDRLQHCEAFLKEQGLNPNAVSHPEADQPDESHRGESPQADPDLELLTPSSVAFEPSTCLSKSRICSDRERVKFVDNSLMTRVAEEFHDAKEDPHESSHEESDGKESEDAFDLVMGASSRRRSRYTHPPTDQIYELWQIFAENVDPLTKVVHVPSLQSALEKATNNIPGLPRSFNALMFAMYSTAVLSLNENECQDRFAQSRSSLLSHYVAATKVALARADFTSSTNIVVLQALILHILSIRDTYDPRSTWILTGVAMRIAEGIGLHRDASSLGLAPFEAEIRRRIWCYLKMHDNRAAEMCGQPKFRGLDADMNMARALTNVNDDEIYPGMPTPPSESSRPTDMAFCAVVSEYFAFARRMAAMNRKHSGLNFVADDFASKESIMPNDEVIQSMEDNIETKYLRYCDPSDPLQLMTILFARYSMNVGRFMAHHPRKWKSREHMPESERKYVWNVSIKLMEQFDMIQSSRHLQKFAWNFAYYLQWWAFIHVLDTLRADPLIPDTIEAWRLVETTFQNNPTIITNTKRSLYVAVGNLCLKAFSARETATAKEQSSIPQVPDFIHKLRQEREAARTRAQARLSSRKEREALLFKTNVTEHPPNAVMRTSQGHLDSNQSASDVPSQSQPQNQELLPPEANGSAYWLVDDFNTAGFGAPNSTPDMSTSFMLTQDQSINDTTIQAIDWTQWDAWLSGTDFQNADT